ncbi:MAG: hypothetical protein WD266_00635 [Balneolales bacterium]
MSVAISMGLMIALIAIGILGMSYFGIVNIYNGKHELAQIATFFVPFLIFIVAYLAMGSLTEAGLLTMLVALATMVLFIFVSGVRSTFKI